MLCVTLVHLVTLHLATLPGAAKVPAKPFSGEVLNLR